MSGKGLTLTTSEQKRLEDLEATIAAGLAGLAEIGPALREINESKLYTQNTFETYCAEVWGFSRSTAYHLIQAADVQDVLCTTVHTPLPTERVARELAPLRDNPEELIGAWQRAVEEHGTPTAAQVRAIVRVEVIEDAEVIDPEPGATRGHRDPRQVREPIRSTATLASFSRAFEAALADGWSLEDLAGVIDRIYRERTT